MLKLLSECSAILLVVLISVSVHEPLNPKLTVIVSLDYQPNCCSFLLEVDDLYNICSWFVGFIGSNALFKYTKK